MTPSDLPAPEPFRRVLVATDFSPGAAAALERTARLPFGRAARVHLLHVLPPEVAPRMRRTASRLAQRSLERSLSLAWRADRRPRVGRPALSAEVRFGIPFVEIIRCARVRGAELVVVGRHGERPVRDLFIGTTAARVLRKGDAPVLLVSRSQAGRYRHPLAATDLQDTSPRVLDLLVRVLGAGEHQVGVVHAYHVPFPGLLPAGSERSPAGLRREYRQRALRGLRSLLASREASRVRWTPVVRHGDPRTVVLKEAVNRAADLLALGTHGRSGVAHALLGSVAEWLITAASCDVLVARPARFSFQIP